MLGSLVVSTAPSVEPFALEELKAELRMDADDFSQDRRLTRLVERARLEVEKSLDQSLLTTTWSYYLDRFPDCSGEYLRLPRAPLQSVSSIKYYDTDNTEQTWSSDEYDTDTHGKPGRVRPKEGYTWPTTYDRPSAVTITFVAGYGDAASDVPESIREAMLVYIEHRLRHDTDELPPAFESLLNESRHKLYA